MQTAIDHEDEEPYQIAETLSNHCQTDSIVLRSLLVLAAAAGAGFRPGGLPPPCILATFNGTALTFGPSIID
jgi:hypothetical protein